MKKKYAAAIVIIIALIICIILIRQEKKEIRPYYNLSREVFKNLPAFPEDFYEIDRKVENSIDVGMKALSENYYKQPEFYPNFENFTPNMKNSDSRYTGVAGYGAYPAELAISTKPNNSFTVITFVHTSWMVQSYQGIKMEAVLSNETEKYFNMTFDPEVFLLEPTFPVFGKNWTQKIVVHINVNNAHSGRYVINVNLGAPPENYSVAWRQKYFYADAGSSGIEGSFLRITVDVA